MIINIVTPNIVKIGNATKLYMKVILNDNSLIEPVITELKVLYGDVNITNNDTYIPNNNNFYGILVKGVYNNINYYQIYYNKAIYINFIPNNSTKLTQKLPKNIFKNINNDSLIGKVINTVGDMYNDYYKQYLAVKNQILSTEYSQNLEYEYNFTQGLLSNSVHSNELFQLLVQAKQYPINVYSIEVFISKYIYYRLGISCAIYINDSFSTVNPYWMLNSITNSQLNVSTKLAPSGYQQTSNIKYNIYNSNSFNDNFKIEISKLIERMTRVDIGFDLIFQDIDPIDDGFILVGATYLTDPRTINNRCIKYMGINTYPLDIIGYTK